MNLIEVARRIPDLVRSQLLLVASDPILNAVGWKGNQQMVLLFDIWFEFVEPHGNKDLNCPYCLARVLENFKAMRPALLQLEKEYRILQAL